MIVRNCNSKQFIENLNGRRVICFGAGTLLIDIKSIRIGKIDYLSRYIDFFVDNDIKRSNTDYFYDNKQFKIFHSSILDEIDMTNYIILVTCSDILDIFTQLDKKKNLNEVECYFYRMVTNFPDVDINRFLRFEIHKSAYQNWQKNLLNLNLKDKYKGRRCFIIGNGPSLKVSDLEMLNGEITFGVNRIHMMFDKTNWRPTYYMCVDQDLYNIDCDAIQEINCDAKFIALSIAERIGRVDNNVIYFKYLTSNEVEIYGQNKIRKKILFSYNILEKIHAANMVLYAVVQLAVYMGFSTIYLLGVDCTATIELKEDGSIIKHNNESGSHFSTQYENNIKHLFSPGSEIYKSILVWEIAKEACEKVGVTIKNATRGGKLEVFERVDFDELMKNK